MIKLQSLFVKNWLASSSIFCILHFTCTIHIVISSYCGCQSLVPMGESFAEPAGNSHATAAPLGFGQGITTSVGANRTLEQVIARHVELFTYIYMKSRAKKYV